MVDGNGTVEFFGPCKLHKPTVSKNYCTYFTYLRPPPPAKPDAELIEAGAAVRGPWMAKMTSILF